MITEKLYKDSVNSIVKFIEFENNLYSATNGAVETANIVELQELIDTFTKLLEYCTKDFPDRYGSSNLNYFFYEQDCGKQGDEYFVTDENGIEYKIHNVNELWEYIKSIHPDIEECDVTNTEELSKKYDSSIDYRNLYEIFKEYFRKDITDSHEEE